MKKDMLFVPDDTLSEYLDAFVKKSNRMLKGYMLIRLPTNSSIFTAGIDSSPSFPTSILPDGTDVLAIYAIHGAYTGIVATGSLPREFVDAVLCSTALPQDNFPFESWVMTGKLGRKAMVYTKNGKPYEINLAGLLNPTVAFDDHNLPVFSGFTSDGAFDVRR